MSDETTERAKLVHNEQVKIRAGFYNTVAAGFVIAGIVTPIATFSRHADSVTGGTLLPMIIWFLVAAGLHYAAILTLERLR